MGLDTIFVLLAIEQHRKLPIAYLQALSFLSDYPVAHLALAIGSE
jgi:hypothetical protein